MKNRVLAFRKWELGCFLLFTLLFTPQTKGAQRAVVTKPRAIVYADLELTSPIGYISRGKHIYVGKVKRQYGSLLPLVLNNKIAWIKTSDIRIEGEPIVNQLGPKKITEHNLEILRELQEQEKIKDSPKRNNYFRLGYAHLFSLSMKAHHQAKKRGLTYKIDQEEKEGQSLSFLFEHRNPFSPLHWGFGLDYYAMESRSVLYETILFTGNLAGTFFQRDWASAEVFLKLLFPGSFRISVKDYGRFRATAYGAEYGLLLRFFTQHSTNLLVGHHFSNWSFQANQVSNPRASNTTSYEKLSSAQLFIGVSYRY